LSARSLDLDRTDEVPVGGQRVVVGREDLEEPQAEEEDREQGQRERSHDGHPPRELRAHRGPLFLLDEPQLLVLGELFHRVWGREIGPRRAAPCWSGLSPPVVEARRRRRRGSSGSTGRMIRRPSACTGSAINVLTSSTMKIC